MVLHVPAIAAATIGYLSAQDCGADIDDESQVGGNDGDSSENQENSTTVGNYDADISQASLLDRPLPSSKPQVSPQFSASAFRRRQQLRQSGQLSSSTNASGDSSLRAVRVNGQMGKYPSRQFPPSLKAIMSESLDNDAPARKPKFFMSPSGFVNGDFSSGLIENICVDNCWVVEYSPRADVLAVGQMGRLNFLEASSNSLICSEPRNDMVSAIKWCSASALEYVELEEEPKRKKSKSRGVDFDQMSATKEAEDTFECCTNEDTEAHYEDMEKDYGDILAVAGLDGQVTIYEVHKSLLEPVGAHVSVEFFAPNQVRCMALKAFGKGVVVLAVGDKGGKITVCSLIRNKETGEIEEIYRMGIYRPNDAVLAIDLDSESKTLAAASKNGSVVVYKLVMDLASQDSAAPSVTSASEVWRTHRNGPVRSVVLSKGHLLFGGYDKFAVWVDTKLWAVIRQLQFQGTIHAIAEDPLDRFIAIGCNDKSVSVLDTSTFRSIKRFETSGWVTTLSWGATGNSNILAVRGGENIVSIYDLHPVQALDNVQLLCDCEVDSESSLTWSPDGDFVARIAGDYIRVVDARSDFEEVTSIKMAGYSIRKIAFSPKEIEVDGKKSVRIAAIGMKGYLQVLNLNLTDNHELSLLHTQFIESNLWTLDFSSDGTLLAISGRSKQLHIFSVEKLKRKKQLTKLESRVWDLSFRSESAALAVGGALDSSCGLVIAVGDCKAVFYDTVSFEPTLQVHRPRAIRCMRYHPFLPVIAVGDGSGFVAIVDYISAETTREFQVSGRVTVLQYSPAGDFLLVGTDDSRFSLHETRTYKPVQTFPVTAFAASGAFASHGKYLALGATDGRYSIYRLGPLLGISYVDEPTQLPVWALDETLYRSDFGPSLVQLQTVKGTPESFLWLATTIKKQPESLLTYDRSSNEGCFSTALQLRKIKLLKLALLSLVDGSLEASSDGRRSILTSQIPSVARETIELLLNEAIAPPEFIVEILTQLRFVKTPFTSRRSVGKEDTMVCGSAKYLDPWTSEDIQTRNEIQQKKHPSADSRIKIMRTPAVLPIPNLGTMEFLNLLVVRAPPTVFDNEAMGVVLRVMWRHHIRQYFVVDFVVFLIYFLCWIALVDATSVREPGSKPDGGGITAAVFTMLLNTCFAAKEFVQSDKGRRKEYFFSLWNAVDLSSILFIYVYGIHSLVPYTTTKGLVRISVITSLLMTVKLLSYLRGFHDTGWLVTVLFQNFRDVKGFLVVLLSILVGFSVSFRSLFARTDPICDLELDEDGQISQDCDEEQFGSIWRSFLSTFELSILGSYDSAMVHGSPHSLLAGVTFILAVTTILVVALNALISVLADSYSRVQQNAVANRRKEKAELIVEYMSLLPPSQRKRIEDRTRYFHALLEADADGDLVVETDDWRGGINSLRNDLLENSDANRRALTELKVDLETDLTTFKMEVLTMLQELQQDIRKIHEKQENGITFNAKQVAGAVNAVKKMGNQMGGG